MGVNTFVCIPFLRLAIRFESQVRKEGVCCISHLVRAETEKTVPDPARVAVDAYLIACYRGCERAGGDSIGKAE